MNKLIFDMQTLEQSESVSFTFFSFLLGKGHFS